MPVMSKKDQMYIRFGHFEQGLENTPEQENGDQVQKRPNAQ